MSGEKQYCTFWIGKLLFGVEVFQVQEVLRFLELTRVPMAPREVRGLMNLRGQLVTAIDLRRRLDLPDREDGKLPMNVVVRCDDEAVSFQVDQIGEVSTVKSDRFEHPPETVRGVARDLLIGTYKLDDNLLIILDVDRTANLPGRFDGEAREA